MPRDKALNEKMRAESQAHIIAAARRLFAERGYFSCKVTDVAREAGMSTGNVYWYYPSKENILQAVLADGFEAHEAVLRDAATHPGTAQEKLDYLLERYLTFCQQQNEFFDVLIAILGHSGVTYLEELGFDMRQTGMRYHQHLTSILTQGQAEGRIIDVAPDALAMLFFSLFNGLMLTYGQTWRTLDRELVRAAVLRLLGTE